MKQYRRSLDLVDSKVARNSGQSSLGRYEIRRGSIYLITEALRVLKLTNM